MRSPSTSRWASPQRTKTRWGRRPGGGRGGEPLVELETDKVAMEVPAPADGVLREIVLQVDAEAGPGAVLGRLAPNVEAVVPEEGPAGESIEVAAQPEE